MGTYYKLNLAHLMKSKGITQTELGKRIGRNQQFVSRLIKKEALDFQTLYQLREALGLSSLDELFLVFEAKERSYDNNVS